MLKSLKLENFKRHEAFFQEFDTGMVVIRGSNEQGKTSILHGIAYALFGIKALPTNIDDTVTWGKPVTTLKVTLVLSIGGTDYTITRGKSGAEINYAGGRVTGQTETINFIENLFGVSSSNASNLVVASQGSIRGALESGPKATADLIENLANFEMIDQIIDLVQSNLVTGPTASAEALLKSADMRLELVKSQVIEPDVTGWEERAVTIDTEAESLKAQAELMSGSVSKAFETANEAKEQQEKAKALSDKTLVYEHSIASRNAAIAQSQVALLARPDTDTITDAEKALTVAVNSAALMQEHAIMVELMAKFPEEFWDDSEASFLAEIVEQQELVAKCREDAVQLQADIRLYNSQKITGSVCGFCNQDTSNFPEVEAKNTNLDTQVALAEKTLCSVRLTGKESTETLDSLKVIQATNDKYKARASVNVQAHTMQIPVSLSWIGIVPKDVSSEDIQNLRRNLSELKAAETAANNADSNIKANEEMVAEYADNLVRVREEMLKFILAPSAQELKATYDCLITEQNQYFDAAKGAAYEAESVRGAILNEQALYARALGLVEDAALDVQITKEALNALEFNNALVKRLRQARPMIADKLWNVVLAAVSSYFSTMRGVRSAVTKAADGFKVDGQSVEGLSGSTLDILGLAIRLALTRTFLPAAPFLILDEPSAACDAGRAQDMIGFLMAFGFTQTLLVTHREMDEGAANQLINI